MFRGRFSHTAHVLVLVIVLSCFTSCKADTNQNCHILSSSCGDIRNISFPFRLKTDPQDCGDPSYELACVNNQTILYLNSKEYYVLSINYENYSIRLLDPGIRKNQCPSFPLHSLTYDDIPTTYTDPEMDEDYDEYRIARLNTPVIFISCPSRVKSSLYVDTASCNTKNTSTNTSSSLKEYNYVLVGDDLIRAGVEDSCIISTVAWFSSEFPVVQKKSFSSILNTMANGFSFRWYRVYCGKCGPPRMEYCYLDNNNNVGCRAITNIDRIYNNLWRIWWALPDFWWGALSNEQFQFKYRPGYSRKGLWEFWWVIFGVVSKLTAPSLLARFLCGVLCLFILIIYKYRRRHLSIDENIEHFLQGQINLVPIRYKYTDIRKMTNKFKDKLGEGGYGSVYKGKLRSGILVAVKMLNKSKASGQEFISEVATIGTIHHINVVQLIGFCVEGSKRALVYEFMPNGSLEKYIFSQEGKTLISLSYEQMFEISLGVARGIDYLHRGCEMQILHFDIKPHNILLDENFNPKVSDFGLAKLYSTGDSSVSLTAARGTMGYMNPELFYKNIGGVSYKADVYSYGMLLLEMAGKRKNLNPFVENLSQIYFPSWVYDQFSAGKEIGTKDTSGEERKMVKKMIIVGLWCIQMKPIDRPSMNKIVEMLEGDDQHLEMPPKPFLYPEQSPAEEDHEIHASDNELPLMSGNFSDTSRLHREES